MTTEGQGRLARAIAAIDSVNAGDPNRLVARGEEAPKELAHARLATEWIERLVDAPSEPLLLAARAHHLRRWALPRSEYPAGRPGYLAWRKELQRRHAEEVGGILANAGYDEPAIERTQAIVRKRGLGRDEEVQAFEDALCLVFLETQLEAFAGAHPPEKAADVLRKTWRKMSEPARALALALDLPADVHALLERTAEAKGA